MVRARIEVLPLKNRSAPSATVTSILIYNDVGQAIDWLCNAFGFTERLRVEREGVTYHAQLAVSECAIILGKQGGPYRAPEGKEVSAYVLVQVDDVDAHYDHAKQSRAEIVHAPTTCRLASGRTQRAITPVTGGPFPAHRGHRTCRMGGESAKIEGPMRFYREAVETLGAIRGSLKPTLEQLAPLNA